MDISRRAMDRWAGERIKILLFRQRKQVFQGRFSAIPSLCGDRKVSGR